MINAYKSIKWCLKDADKYKKIIWNVEWNGLFILKSGLMDKEEMTKLGFTE